MWLSVSQGQFLIHGKKRHSPLLTVIMLDKIDQIIAKYAGREGVLIQILLDIQQEYSWISPQVAKQISQKLDIPLSRIYSIASFYKAMSLTPRGKHLVKVCLGTACHVRGGAKIMEKVELALGINAGETTPEMDFTLQRVNCLGCCALGPVVVIDGEYHGRIAPHKVEEILKRA